MIINLADINNYFITLNFLSIDDIQIYYFHNKKFHYLLSNPRAFIRDARQFYIIRLCDIDSYDLKIRMANIADIKILASIFSEYRADIEPVIKAFHVNYPVIMAGVLTGGGIDLHEDYLSLFKCYLMLQYPRDKNTFLHYAVIYQNIDLARLVIRLGINVNSINNEGKTALHIACEVGNYYICDLLLNSGALIDIQDDDNWYPLNFAIMNNFSRDILIRLVFKQDKSMFDMHVVSPILLASQYSDVEFVEYLIQNGADINTVDVLGKTPIIYSLENKYNRVFKLLLSYEPNLNFITCEGYSLLCYGLLGKFDIRYVLNLVDVNMILANGYTALHIAAILDDSYSFKLLMARGANTNNVSCHGLSVFDCALLSDSKAIIDILKDYCISMIDISSIKYLFNREKNDLIFSMLNTNVFFQGQKLSKLGIFASISTSSNAYTNNIENKQNL